MPELTDAVAECFACWGPLTGEFQLPAGHLHAGRRICRECAEIAKGIDDAERAKGKRGRVAKFEQYEGADVD